MNEVTEQKFESSLQSLSSIQLCCKSQGDAFLGVMSRGFQGAKSQTRRAWAIEAGEGDDGQEHEGCLPAFDSVERSGEKAVALIIGVHCLSLRTVSVDYLGSHSRELRREWGMRK